MSSETNPASDRELILTRLIDAPREAVFRAWTDPRLLTQWFAPLPWTTPAAELDARPGGACLVIMRDPEGHEFPNRGVYLEVVPNERLVFTDAYTKAWEPSGKPFMTVILTFEDEGGRVIPPACGTGPLPTARGMRRWDSTRGGAGAPISSRRSRRGCRTPMVILLANSAFAQCSHQIRPEFGWRGGFRGRIAHFCLPWSAQRRIRQQYQW